MLYITYTSDGDLPNSVFANLGGGHLFSCARLTQDQHHVAFGTRWELNHGCEIRIPHRVPLHHGPTIGLSKLKMTRKWI